MVELSKKIRIMAKEYPQCTMSEATIKAMVEKIKTFTEEQELISEILTNKDMRVFCGCKVNDTYSVIKIQSSEVWKYYQIKFGRQ